MMVSREEEAGAEVGERRGRHFACARHVEAERFQRVGGTRFRGSGAISMLCDRDLTCCNDDRHRGRDVERVVPVAAGAADVDRPFGRLDRDQPVAHRLRRGGDLDHRLAAVGESGEESGELFVAAAAVEHRRERRLRLVMVEEEGGIGKGAEAAHAACRSVTGRPAMRRKLASIAWPCSVAMLSGWNWTPWIGSSTRSEEHTSELQSLMRISYAVFCLKKKRLNQ